jgi:hypothetical protein
MNRTKVLGDCTVTQADSKKLGLLFPRQSVDAWLL